MLSTKAISRHAVLKKDSVVSPLASPEQTAYVGTPQIASHFIQLGDRRDGLAQTGSSSSRISSTSTGYYRTRSQTKYRHRKGINGPDADTQLKKTNRIPE